MKHHLLNILLILLLTGPVTFAKNPLPTDKKLPEGTAILIETQSLLSTDFQCEGNSFSAFLAEDLRFKSRVIAPAGTPVNGYVVESARAGRLSSQARLTLTLTAIMINGKWVDIETDRFSLHGKKSGTGAKVGGGAIIGAILGGRRGARNGAIVGLGIAAASKGKQIELPPGSLIEFYLREPLEIKRNW